MDNSSGDQTFDGNYRVIKVTCPACQYRLDAQLRREETSTMCPECWEDVPVPSAASFQSRKASARTSPHGQQSTRRKTPANKRKPNRDSQTAKQAPQAAEHQAAARAVVCTNINCQTCHARVEVTLNDQVQYVTCPDCDLDLRVPRIQDVPQHQRFAQPDGDTESDFYRTVEPVGAQTAEPSDASPPPAVVNPRRDVWPERTSTRKQRSSPERQESENSSASTIGGTNVGLDATDDLRTEKPQTPPRWTFFSGVFTFVWYPEIRGRWLRLCCGCLVIAFLFQAFLLPVLAGGIGSLNFGSAILFVTFAAADGLLSVFMGAYAAATLLPILIETASGNDHIFGWAELGITDWLSDLFFASIPISAVAAATYGVAQGVELCNGPSVPVAIATFPMILTVALLSSLESNVPWNVVSPAIVRSLGKHWSVWAVFYVISLGWMGVWVLMTVMISNTPAWTSLVAGPLSATLLFIYARLLGRLGWKVTRRKRKSRKRKNKDKQTSQ